MSFLGLAIGERGRDGGMSDLDRTVRVGDVQACDRVDVESVRRRGLFCDLQHFSEPLKNGAGGWN